MKKILSQFKMEEEIKIILDGDTRKLETAIEQLSEFLVNLEESTGIKFEMLRL